MPTDNPLSSLHRLVWTALLAALIAVGAYLYFPLGPAPVSLQTFFVLLAGYILGPAGGAIAVCLYLGAGLIGLPIFSGGKAGLGHLLGPTGGYIFGFIVGAAVAGLGTRGRPETQGQLRLLLSGFLATACIYLVGVAWLKTVLNFSWLKAMTVGLFPFLPGDALKLFAAAAAFRFLSAKRLLPP